MKKTFETDISIHSEFSMNSSIESSSRTEEYRIYG